MPSKTIVEWDSEARDARHRDYPGKMEHHEAPIDQLVIPVACGCYSLVLSSLPWYTSSTPFWETQAENHWDVMKPIEGLGSLTEGTAGGWIAGSQRVRMCPSPFRAKLHQTANMVSLNSWKLSSTSTSIPHRVQAVTVEAWWQGSEGSPDSKQTNLRYTFGNQ